MTPTVPGRPSANDFVVGFGQLSGQPDRGGKARSLIVLRQAGFPVPPGGVLGHEAFERQLDDMPELKLAVERLANSDGASSAKLREEIRTAISQLELNGDVRDQVSNQLERLKLAGFASVAVRSSANVEDGSSHSFAGQFETRLQLEGSAQVEQAIKTCWASRFSDQVIAYCAARGIPATSIRLNVVIQAMIPAEVSGVLFTIDPLDGDDKTMVIEAVAGLGEALVQGAVTPETCRYDWYRERWCQQARFTLLPDEQALELVSLALEIQQHFGAPQDIEWAYFQGAFHVLQARPITAIHFPVDEEWTNADLRDGGIGSTISSPLMYSLYESIFESSMPSYLRATSLLPRKPPAQWFRSWFGYAYWNLSAVKEGVQRLPGYCERRFDESLGIEPQYQGDGHTTRWSLASLWSGLRISLAIDRSIRRRLKQCPARVTQIQENLRRFDAVSLTALTDDSLLKLARDVIEQDFTLAESSYFLTIYDNSNAATLFRMAFDKHQLKTGATVAPLRLLGGLELLSHLRPTIDLWELGRLIRNDPEAENLFLSTHPAELSRRFASKDIPFNSELERFITSYRHHSHRELDLLVPRWQEDPAQVFQALVQVLSQQRTSPVEAQARQRTLYRQERNKIRSRLLLRRLETHRRLLWWREELRDYSTRTYYVIRKVWLEMASRLVARGMIDQRDDLFMLTFADALSFFAGEDPALFQDRIRKNWIFYRSYRNFDNPNEIRKRDAASRSPGRAASAAAAELRGVGCAPGICTGTAFVIASIFDIDELEPGAILVTKFTDPSWTPVFANIRGLVTETGGMLSHGAIVSREFGIPAVMVVDQATTRIRTGQRIEVDGNQGRVTLLAEAS